MADLAPRAASSSAATTQGVRGQRVPTEADQAAAMSTLYSRFKIGSNPLGSEPVLWPSTRSALSSENSSQLAAVAPSLYPRLRLRRSAPSGSTARGAACGRRTLARRRLCVHQLRRHGVRAAKRDAPIQALLTAAKLRDIRCTICGTRARRCCSPRCQSACRHGDARPLASVAHAEHVQPRAASPATRRRSPDPRRS
jgi:hypothetical protein